jgi:hypothetical protein
MRLWHLLVAVAAVAVAFGLIRAGTLGRLVLFEMGALGLWKLCPSVVRWMDRIETSYATAPAIVRLAAVYGSGLAVFLYLAIAYLWLVAAVVMPILVVAVALFSLLMRQ